MAGKLQTAAPPGKVTDLHRALQPAQRDLNPLFGLQQTAGNQAMVRLLQSGTIQPKLRISQPGDADEVEADRLAEQIVTSRNSAPALQRKCACAGGPACSKCTEEEEEEESINRSVATPIISPSQPSIQRSPSDQPSIQIPSRPSSSSSGPPARNSTYAALIVEDDAPTLAPGQMKKSQFMQLLRVGVCATADAALAAKGRSSKGCPYIEQWIAFYAVQSGPYIERALHKYAPETAGAKRAHDYLSIINDRVRQAVTMWARTGQIAGVPPGVPLMAGSAPSEGGGAPPASGAHGRQGAAGGASAGSSPPGPKVLTKRRDSVDTTATEAESVRGRLGPGRALDNSVRSRMEPAFGQDFSHVRLHTDSNAAHLSTELNARAFTMAENVAFASGEYKPGTLVGDALIAHELAHVVQQGRTSPPDSPLLKGQSEQNALEADADDAAVGVIASVWAGAKGKLAEIGRNAVPRLKSGLRLQACRRTVRECPKGLHWAVVGEPAATGPVCVCAWRCLPPGVGFSLPTGSPDNSGPSIRCSYPDSAGRCPDDPNYETVDKDYEKTGQGTIVGVGAHMSPLGEQAACGCLPLNIEGAATGEKQVNAPLLPPGIDITDVLAPAADMAAAAKSRAKPRQDTRTGAPRQLKHEAPQEHNSRPTVVEHGEPNAPHADTLGPKATHDATHDPTTQTPPPTTTHVAPGGSSPPPRGPGVRVVTVTGDTVVVDTNIARALDKAAKDPSLDSLQDGEKRMVEYAKSLGVAVTPESIGELGKKGGVGATLSGTQEVTLPPAERQAIKNEVSAVVGGAGDREVVTQTLLAKAAPGVTPVFATADRGVINGLARLAPPPAIPVAKLGRYKTVAEYLHYERKTDSFTINIRGRSMIVRPVQEVRPGL